MPSLEVADIFRDHGRQWRQSHAGHIKLRQLKAMSAIERCRTAALGGHVLRCGDCSITEISYNSCRNRHCPKCQSVTAFRWLEARKNELLPVEYFHVVFTLPAIISDVAFQNPEVVYNILFKAASKTLLALAADPKHLGASAAMTAVLHTWGSALTHHPHLHCVVPGGGLSLDHKRWISCRKGFFLPVKVLSRLFRRLFIEQLVNAYKNGLLEFHNKLASLEDSKAFEHYLRPAQQADWVVYAKRPFSGPKAVLSYLSRYTHRVAIANSRLLTANKDQVTFKFKDYRLEGKKRFGTMTLATDEFIRRFLIHIVPDGFHRIRHYGFLANAVRKEKLPLVRQALQVPEPTPTEEPTKEHPFVCKSCGVQLLIVKKFEHTHYPARAPPTITALAA